MQALFYMVFFGLLYALIGFVTFGATETTAELTQRHIQSVKKMFKDVEVAVLDNYLRENIDIASLLNDDGVLDPTLLTPYLSWSETDLTRSPWNTDIIVCQNKLEAPDTTAAFSGSMTSNQRSTLLYADENGYLAADTYTFILAATGPNRRFDVLEDGTSTLDSLCGATGQLLDMQATLAAIGNTDSDDIIHIFNTRPAQERIANDYMQAENKILEVIYEGYAQRFLEVSNASLIGGYDYYVNQENANTGSDVNQAIVSGNYALCYQDFTAAYCHADTANYYNDTYLKRYSVNNYSNRCAISDPNTELSLSEALMFCYLASTNQNTRNDGTLAGTPVAKPNVLGFDDLRTEVNSKYNFDVEEICNNPFGDCSASVYTFKPLEKLVDNTTADQRPMYRTVLTLETGQGGFVSQDWQVYREVYIDALNILE